MTPPISDYGFIADCLAAALVSRHGSIDWEKGGYFQIAPAEQYASTREYVDDTLILKTSFRTQSGIACLYAFFAMRKEGKHSPYRQLLRIIEGLEGKVAFSCGISPAFDYGTIKPWIRDYGKGASGDRLQLRSADFGRY